MLIGPILNKIQLLKNLQFVRDNIWVTGDTFRTSFHFLLNSAFLNGCISFNIRPVNTKLENVPNRNVLFLTMWVSCSLSHNKQTRFRPARFEIRQCQVLNALGNFRQAMRAWSNSTWVDHSIMKFIKNIYKNTKEMVYAEYKGLLYKAVTIIALIMASRKHAREVRNSFYLV